MARSLLLVIGLFVLSTGAAHAQEPPTESERVIATLMAALDSHDVSRAAQLFAPDAQVLTPTPVDGRTAIQGWLGGHFSNDIIVEVTTYGATGQRVMWMTRISQGDSASSPRYVLTWDEAVVVNGQITLWTSRGLADAMASSPQFRRARTLDPTGAAESGIFGIDRATAPLVFGGSMLTAVMFGAVFGVWRWRSRRTRRRHQLQGGEMLRTLQERLAAQR